MKTGDKIVITKPGKFFELTGEIISNNELADKPLTVDLNPYGVWSFRIDEVTLEGKPKVNFDYKVSNGYPSKIANIIIEHDQKPAKRAYKKRSDKPKEVKIKRAYNPKKLD